MSTTAVVLFILLGYSFQQDAIINECINTTEILNTYCLSTTSFSYVDAGDLSRSYFCSNGLAFTQCIDASCISPKVRNALNLVVPGLNRPHICPICYDQPATVTEKQKTCTTWGLNHVIPFNGVPETCLNPGNTSYPIFSNPYFSLTASTSIIGNSSFYGIMAVRFDYKSCAAYSRTWRRSETWKDEIVPTQGWFPHTIHITLNATQAFIALPALNTEIVISVADLFLAVSVATGIRTTTSSVSTSYVNGVCLGGFCSLDNADSVTPPQSGCASLPKEFRQGNYPFTWGQD